EEEGTDSLARLNGMFALAIWDDRLQQLFLARDRIGIKPLYVYDNGESITFGSELKALLSDPDVPRDLDMEAFAYYLRYGYVAAPATLFQHIRKLPPAHYLVAGREQTCIRRFWDVSYATDSLPEEEYADRLHEVLRRSIKRQL